MSRFTLVPTDGSPQIVATNASAVFRRMRRLKCGEADVLEEGEYAFSLRKDSSGFWSIYQREGEPLRQVSDALI